MARRAVRKREAGFCCIDVQHVRVVYCSRYRYTLDVRVFKVEDDDGTPTAVAVAAPKKIHLMHGRIAMTLVCFPP